MQIVLASDRHMVTVTSWKKLRGSTLLA